MWTQPHTWRKSASSVVITNTAAWSLLAAFAPAGIPCVWWLRMNQWPCYRARINQRMESYLFTSEQAFMSETFSFFCMGLLFFLSMYSSSHSPHLKYNTVVLSRLEVCEKNLAHWSTFARHWVITGLFPVLSFPCSHHYVHRRSP